MIADDARRRQLGALCAVAAAVTYSTAGLFTTLIALDAWSLLFWRGLFAGLFLALISLWIYRRRVGRLRPAFSSGGLTVIGLTSISMIMFISSLRHTSVADVAVIYATAPFMTAGLALLWTKERTSRRTIMAGALALLGVMVMMIGGVGQGRLLGNVLAFAMTLTNAATMVAARRHAALPLIPIVAAASFLTSLVCAPLAVLDVPSLKEAALLATFGVSQLGLGLLFMIAASRLAGAAETALIGALDTPLAPFWIWLFFGVVPTVPTLIGGCLVLLAVAYEMGLGYFSRRLAVLPKAPLAPPDACLPPTAP